MAAAWALMLVLSAASPIASVVPSRQCEGPDVDPWVSDFRMRVESYDELYAFAVERFGTPTSCEGEITTEFDGAPFGSLRFGFAGGVSYAVETMPIETSIAVLRAPAGFEDPEAVRGTLEAHAARIGLAIDWTSPEVTAEGDELVRTYGDPDPGLNASASLIYAGETLVGIRLSMAL